MESSNEHAKIDLVIFSTGSDYYAIIQAPNPKPPINFQISENTLRELRQDISNTEKRNLHNFDQSTTEGLQESQSSLELCGRIYETLFPEPVRLFLNSAKPQQLVLHLEPSLLNLPWEYAHDGEQYLAIKFDMTRQLVVEEHTSTKCRINRSDTLRILQLVDSDIFDAYKEAIKYFPESENLDNIEIEVFANNSFSKKGLSEIADKFSVLHYVGPIISRSETDSEPCWQLSDHRIGIGEAASLCDSCSLIISEHYFDGSPIADADLDIEKIVKPAHINGKAQIVNTRRLPINFRIDFQRELYKCIYNNMSLGQSLSKAHQKLMQRWGLGLNGYQCYGDPSLHIFQPTAPVTADATSRAGDPQAEYRHITVMFCDLVNSTAISEHFGVEEWGKVLQGYFDHCRDIVCRHGGSVHQFKGDGLVVYFGYPIAYEDGALRAIRAALEISTEFKKGAFRQNLIPQATKIDELNIRVGIHTGPVIVAEISGSATATGLTVAFAERLQSVAPPNEVVISSETHKLVKLNCKTRALGKKTLKGIRNPKDCFQVLGELDPEESNALLEQEILTPFFGRADEMFQLEYEWRTMAPGDLRFVVVSGEAGIGKSRLIQEFCHKLHSKKSWIFKCRCSTYFKNSSLYPISQLLNGFFRLQPEWSNEEKLSSIKTRIPAAINTPDLLTSLSHLLSIRNDPQNTKQVITADQQKRANWDAIVKLLNQLSLQKPVVLVIEDAHWIDPSTRDFLNYITECHCGGSILILMTYRADDTGVWHFPTAAQQINLKRLSDKAARKMIVSSTNGSSLPEEIVSMLVEKTDGVPLFIEESTAMARDALNNKLDNLSLPERHAGISIPTTIQDLLTARLDSLGEIKETAQLAATIGREFSFELISAVSKFNRFELSRHLTSLVNSGLLLARTVNQVQVYVFKHALVRDAAYQSLLSARRRSMHRQIAATLTQAGFDNQDNIPELLAYHYQNAGETARAIEYWITSGKHAIAKSAQAEAINHYNNALELLRSLPNDNGIETAPLELRVLLSLASCHVAIGGYSADVVAVVCERAETLARSQRDDKALLRARFGLESFHFMRGDFQRAHSLARECLELAASMRPEITNKDSDSAAVDRYKINLARCHWTVGNILFHQAKFVPALQHLDISIEFCKTIKPAQRQTIQDPEVASYVYKAWYAWDSGLPDQALDLVVKGVNLARKCGHPFSVGFALAFQACIYLFRKEFESSIELATASIAVSKEPGYRVWLGWAKVIRGRAMCEYDKSRSTGITDIVEGLRLWDESNAIITRPFALALLGESYHLGGQTDKALDLLIQAERTVEQYGERYYEAEIKRLLGYLKMQENTGSDENTWENAAHWLRDAIVLARARGTRSTELRALTDLTTFELEAGRPLTAAADLLKVFSSFKEGLDTGDLIAARKLIDRLDKDGAQSICFETEGA